MSPSRTWCCIFVNLGTDHVSLIEEVAGTAKGRRHPQVILCPHEAVAVRMAAGYALASGCGQAVFVHVDGGTACRHFGAAGWKYHRLVVRGTDLAAKRLELLRGLGAGFPRLAILANVGAGGAMLEMHKTQATASTLGVEAGSLEIGAGDQIAPAIAMLKNRADAL